MIQYLNILIFAVIVAILVLLNKWCQKHGLRLFSLIIYFLVSTLTTPLYTRSTEHGKFGLWVPMGFAVALIYMYMNDKLHRVKLTVSLAGFLVACFFLLKEYHIIA